MTVAFCVAENRVRLGAGSSRGGDRTRDLTIMSRALSPAELPCRIASHSITVVSAGNKEPGKEPNDEVTQQ